MKIIANVNDINDIL